MGPIKRVVAFKVGEDKAILFCTGVRGKLLQIHFNEKLRKYVGEFMLESRFYGLSVHMMDQMLNDGHGKTEVLQVAKRFNAKKNLYHYRVVK